MCGIVGQKLFDSTKQVSRQILESALVELKRRGPDSNGIYINQAIGLGQTRLSIIDPSEKGNQPMHDPSGRFTLIFNGEIYNYKELEKELTGVNLKSSCDTEVLLHLLIKDGASALEKLNGFFGLAFYDNSEDELLLARDRMGIKPLLYYQDQDQFIFGSEMKALLSYPIQKQLNSEALFWYLKLNYVPGDLSMIKGIKKLKPGHFIKINGSEIINEPFWKLEKKELTLDSYTSAQNKLVDLIEASVKKRLMADVPLGSFLSGGTDSSAVVAIAARHHPNISTFSIGYKDHPFFDETKYAEIVAKKFNTNHHVFSLTNDDLLNALDGALDYIDEPFADSSALPTYILSKHVSKHVKVALSGDGADELFGGYYKHLALNRSLKFSATNHLLKILNPLLASLPQSRSGRVMNLIRRLDRYGKMMKTSSHERYWQLASLTNNPEFLLEEHPDQGLIDSFKRNYLSHNPSFNEYLDTDLQIVLPGDMLHKVDMMSMANSLEVRVPFLDPTLVDFARSIPDHYKLKGSMRKRIVQDAFRKILPAELYNRPKKGFEVPLLQWMQKELLGQLDRKLFNREYLNDQRVFDSNYILPLREKLLSRNPGDVHGVIWALYIFQRWYQKYMA